MAVDINKVWTIGYGISTKEEFIRRLSIAFPQVKPDVLASFHLVDIRKHGSGSRNVGNWANWGEEMQKTCHKAMGRYIAIPELANPHGNTKRGMDIYENELLNGHRRPFLNELVKDVVEHPERKYCLMCSERKPFKGRCHADPRSHLTTIGHWDGASNCHRARVATNLTARAWYDYHKKYQVIHIYGGEPRNT
jgi:hypothetical protein